MPFGLKNTRATYQRMITKIFKSIMSKTTDTYINDMVVKNKKESDHVKDLTINNLVSPRTMKEVQKLTEMATTLN